MNLRQLECFCAVAESLSFSKAATKVGMAQPPLSMQIRALETQLGIRLFERRGTKQVILTPAGRDLLPHAQRVLNDAESIVRAADASKTGASGTIKVGAGYSAILTVVPDVICRLQRDKPQIEVAVHSLVGRDQISALLEGSIEVGISRGPVSHPELFVELLFQERFVAALPQGHRLAHNKSLTAKDLSAEPLVVTVSRPESYNVREIAMSFFGGESHLNVKHRVSELSSAVALVRAQLGISLVPQSISNILVNGISYVPLRGQVPLSTVCLVRHKNNSTGIIAKFSEAAHKVSESYGR